MILVALRAGGYFTFADELPPGVVVVEGPGIAIGRVVDAFLATREVGPDQLLFNVG